MDADEFFATALAGMRFRFRVRDDAYTDRDAGKTMICKSRAALAFADEPDSLHVEFYDPRRRRAGAFWRSACDALEFEILP